MADTPSVPTTYNVLKESKGADGSIYLPVAANVAARSSGEAIEATVKEAGTYVAVPARAFSPVTVKVETQTKIKLS